MLSGIPVLAGDAYRVTRAAPRITRRTTGIRVITVKARLFAHDVDASPAPGRIRVITAMARKLDYTGLGEPQPADIADRLR